MTNPLIVRTGTGPVDRNFTKLRDSVKNSSNLSSSSSLKVARDASDADKLKAATLAQPFSGSILTGLSVTTLDKKISHRLGFPVSGFIIIHKDKDVRIWETTPRDDSSYDRNSYITLKASVNATISLWVF